MLVACLALVLSMGGVSYAATRIGTPDIKRNAVTSPKIKDGTITLRDINAGSKAALGVRAFASVTTAASFEPSRVKGFTAVTRPLTGVYCLTLSPRIDPATTAPVVSVEWDDSSGNNLFAFLSKGASGCPAGTDFGVRTVNFEAGGNNLPSNSVAFTIAVP
jgi:hypothetical protein